MKRRILGIVLALCLCTAYLPLAQAQEEPGSIPEAYADTVPSAEEIYQTLISFKDKEGYTEGTLWTDDDHSYTLKVPINGVITSGTGCAAFAFELSDAAFGSLPARKLTSFTYADIKVGDILRVKGNTHSVIVLQVSDQGVVVAEGNYNSSVHWGRSIDKATIESDCTYIITRYPEWYDPEIDSDAPIETNAQGTLEGGLSWKVTNGGVLTISGSGAMPESFSFTSNGDNPLSDRPWNSYISRILSVKIDSGVTRISANAFRECKNIVSVSISEGVTSIGNNAFRACEALKSITLPASVTSVGAGAFWECTELENVAFRPGTEIVAIGDNLFTRCYKLSSVILPQKVDCIGVGMFQNCLTLTSLTVPEGAESIGGSAFASCDRLTKIWIPETVTTIDTAAFSASGLTDIYFGGDETQWARISKLGDTATTVANMTIHYNTEKPATPEIPDEPDDSTSPSTPEAHVHNWSSAWSSDSGYHWHDCSAAGCTVSANSGKDGYAAHSYGGWITDQDASAYQDGSRHRTCTVCGYTQTETIPATGGSDWNAPYIPPSTVTTPPSNTSTSTKPAEDSDPVPEPDNTVTVQHPDGSQTVTVTGEDGTVTTRETDAAGNVTETALRPDGSSTTQVERTDGTTAAVSVDTAGRMEAEVRLSAAAVRDAQQSGEAVLLPIPKLQAVRDAEAAPVVTVNTGSAEPVRVEIPAVDPAPGTVAVLVLPDGTETVIKTSVPTAEGVTAALPDGAAVKLVDNSKDFSDISAGYWGEDAIDFVSAREIFGGTTATEFTPDAPMTRAMLMVALARFDGADTSGGDTWYSEGLAWAVANGISDGSGLDDSITREQLVTMLWRYAGCPAAAGELSAFTDAGQISGYAQEALSWAVENGILGGFGNGQIQPQGQATRAQVAQMLMNFIRM